MLEKLYLAFCNRLRIRPLTYQYRDLWHRYELLAQLQWFFFGIGMWLVAGIDFSRWQQLGIYWAVYLWGYFNGHFFFGTPYIAGQTAPTDDEMEAGG